jgi:hypothetical protein
MAMVAISVVSLGIVAGETSAEGGDYSKLPRRLRPR